MIEVEKMGRPAVPLVSGRFEGDAIASSRTFGMPGLQFVVVPRIYRNLSPAESIRNTEPAFDDLVRTLTTAGPASSAESDGAGGVDRFEGDDRLDALLRMNEEYIARDLGDGFPLMAATREAVDALLEGVALPPDHVVCDVPPGFGLATVEKIAVNAALAGAKPEHMPVIVAAVKALSQVGPHGGKSLLMSTSPNAPLLVVNGPAAAELGINPRSALGPGRDKRRQHHHRPRILPMPQEHRLLVPQQDGHGHDRLDPQVRHVHRREREDEPVGPVPRRPGL